MMSELEETNQPENANADVSTPDVNAESFEQMLSDYDYQLPKQGEILEGRVIRVDTDAILVDVGLKRDAIVSGREYSVLDTEFLEGLRPGDTLHVLVLRPPSGDQDFQVSINKGLEFENWARIEKQAASGGLMELEVVGYNKGGLLVRYENLRGFVPASQVPELRRTNERQRIQNIKQDFVGRTLMVKPIEVDQERNRLVFSATAAHEERRKTRLKELEKNQIILRARVVSVVDFGVFADLDGVDGLVHISQLDWKVVNHPSELFNPGDEIDVQVIEVDVERERVSLSRKALLPSPWESLEERYRPGDVIQGKITRVMDFGAFVEIEAGIEGLVHVSELGYSASGKPEELVSVGEEILVRVLDINPKKERISLSMRRVPMGEQISWLATDVEPGGQPKEAEEAQAALEGEPAEQSLEPQAEEAPEPRLEEDEKSGVEEVVQPAAEAELAPEDEAAAAALEEDAAESESEPEASEVDAAILESDTADAQHESAAEDGDELQQRAAE